MKIEMLSTAWDDAAVCNAGTGSLKARSELVYAVARIFGAMEDRLWTVGDTLAELGLALRPGIGGTDPGGIDHNTQ